MKKFLLTMAVASIMFANGGAAANDIKSTSTATSEINYSESRHFKNLDFYNMDSMRYLTILPHYPTSQQIKDLSAATSVLYYYGNHDFNKTTLPNSTNSKLSDMVNFFETLDWHVESSSNHKTFNTFAEFKTWAWNTLQQGTPIIVEDFERPGHWQVIIGYDSMETDNPMIEFSSDADDPLNDVLIMTNSHGANDQNIYAINNAHKFWPGLSKSKKNHSWLIARPKTLIETSNSTIAAEIANSEIAKKTNQIILVVGHNLSLWNKQSNGQWKSDVQSYCGFGKNGMTFDKYEGDGMTPCGAFPILYAAGFLPKLETKIEYKQITPSSQLSSENNSNYNTWLERLGMNDASEQMMDYYEYKYILFIGYNVDPVVYGRGSAIFVRCKEYEGWDTAGSISVPENVMLELMQKVHKGVYIMIVPTIDDIDKVER